MNLNESTTEDGWCFAWTTPAGHKVELEWAHGPEKWVRRARPADPDGSKGGWTQPQNPPLPVPESYDHAREIAENHAHRRTP